MTTAIVHRNRDDVARDQRSSRVLGDQVVVDGHCREQQQVHDRVAEPPQHVLREQRVDGDAGVGRLDDHLDQQHGEGKRRDDHVDGDDGQRDDRVGDGLWVGRELAWPQVAEPEGEPQAVADRLLHRVEFGTDNGVQDSQAPGDDAEADEQDGCREEPCREVTPLPGGVERKRVEEYPRSSERHAEGADDDADDAEHEQPERRLDHEQAERAQLESELRQYPDPQAHHGKARPAEERPEPVDGHRGVIEVVADATDVGQARAKHRAEQAADEEDRGGGCEVSQRPDARGVHAGGHWATSIRASILACPTPQYSKQTTW